MSDREKLVRLVSLLDQANKIARKAPPIFITEENSREQTEGLTLKSYLDSTTKTLVSHLLQHATLIATAKSADKSPVRFADASPTRGTQSVKESRGLVPASIPQFRATTIAHVNNMKPRDSLQLGSPLEKVLKIIDGLKRKIYDTYDIEDLNYILKVVSSNELYRPNLELFSNTEIDSEIQEWLMSDVLRRTSQNKSRSINNIKSAIRVSPSSKSLRIENDQTAKLLENLDAWEFDIFKLRQLTNGQPLRSIGYEIFKRLDLISRWNIDDQKLLNFLRTIESGYLSNPFHNSCHAADATHSMYYFLVRGGLSQHLSELEILAAIVACIIHDYEHPGLNNSFQIKTRSAKAMLYNDKSVLENYHLAASFRIIKNEENNIFSGLSKEEAQEIRELIISMVFATDMVLHFDIVGQFRVKSNGGQIEQQNKDDRHLLLQMAIKCADISYSAKPLRIARQWAALLLEEYFIQGDKERELGLTISAFMDRQTSSIPKCQLAFLSYIAKPTFEAFSSFLPNLAASKDLLQKNSNYWESQNL